MKRKFRLKIITKLILGFGIILLSFLAAYVYIYQKITENQELTKVANNNIVPSMSELNKFSFIIFETKHLIKNWVLYEKYSNSIKKNKLKQINQTTYIGLKYDLKNLSNEWTEEEQLTLSQIYILSDNYFMQQDALMRELNTPDKYEIEDFYEKFGYLADDDNPLMELADNIKEQTDELYASKKNRLLSYNVEIENSFTSFTNRIIISGIILVIMVLIIAFLFVNSMLTPLNYIRKIIRSMSEGDLPNKQIKASTDEIGQMGMALNNLISGLRDKANFAKDIEKGNFKSFFKVSGTNDILGNSLLTMRDSLAEASKFEKIREKETAERSWSTQGISEFNNLIREHNDSPEEFALVTINKLTRYTESQVGGFYMVNEKDEKNIFLELIAFYAYDRHKFFENKIDPGQNLVGQCYLEKDTIFITDIPENYIKISSGLGKDSPKSVLIVPLIMNEKVYGVVELASFEIYEPYQKEFVAKVGEILASTIATIQINIQTSQLLEESNEKSKILEKQEEESINNIERLNTELDEADIKTETLTQKNNELLEKIKELEDQNLKSKDD